MYAVHDKKIPTRLIDLLYGTNGMSAGNSKYEAMAQALCEIIERHIVVKLLSNNIKLYNITEVIGTSTQYKEFINSINDTDYIINLFQVESDFGVYIYVLTISHESFENMICKIGIHPIKEYAIQRTFSELVQNQSIENVISTILKSKDIHNYTSVSNLKRIFKDNTGFFSKKLLDNMTSNKPLDYTYNSYQEVCQHICNYSTFPADISKQRLNK